MLTKSLHTVTAALNVARLLLVQRDYISGSHVSADSLAMECLQVLGYRVTPAELTSDATVAKVLAGCRKLLNVATER